MNRKNVIIFGGLGFIGSHIVKKFMAEGFKVTIVDGLIEGTGGNLNNVNVNRFSGNLIKQRIEDIADLSELLEKYDLIIDSMGWTSHLEAIKNPIKDLELNVKSHLILIQALENLADKLIIYLGSRGQYGAIQMPIIHETTPMIPIDVQGINKLSAESFYRIYSRHIGFNVISLRISNCFGENQMTNGRDIGLIGSFIRDALNENEIIVYGKKRKRSVIYVKDLADIVYRLSQKKIRGFQPLNINGISLEISELAKKIVSIAGNGKIIEKKMDPKIEKIDVGSALLSEEKLKQIISDYEYTDIDYALTNTIKYFKRKFANDMAL